MSGWEDLETLGAFGFDQARAELDRLMDPVRSVGTSPEWHDGVDLTRDLALLGAAGLHVAGRLGDPELEPPVAASDVGVIEARVSFLKVDCAGTFIHSHRPPESLRLWDVLVFTGDVTKLVALGVESVVDLAENFDDTFGRLVGLYAGSASPFSRAVAASGWLHLEALVWRATLTRLLAPDQMAHDLATLAEQFEDRLTFLHGPMPA